jgi:hypothetical protein
MYTKFYVENLNGRENLGDLGRQKGNTEVTIKEIGHDSGTGLIWFRTGFTMGSCEHNYEPSGSTKSE